ncbi:MAG: flagellar motor switch protein FliN [Sphingomonas sp.]|nr:MAG: flagellar motor switch protein FliN [Sphingomonas sp.]
MNAIPPKGQMAARSAKGAKTDTPGDSTDEHVRLTMDFASELATDAVAAAPDAAEESDPRTAPLQQSVPAGLAALELTLTVEVGQLRIPLKDLMAVEPGQLLALDRMTAEPVAVLVNGKLFARGEIVAVGERFGVRLTDIADTPGLG